jgi:beta-1,4-mannosyl-glycoprotein beta-1,4-N-acetylglucosaminyltransferase
MAKVFDVFPLFNELDLLEIRINELNDVVDFFVITESSKTFSGNPKPYFLEMNWEKFSNFSHKILYHKLDSIPAGLSAFEREWFQRDSVKHFLRPHVSDEDLILYGDLDEIPRQESVRFAISQLNQDVKIAHFAMDLYYYFVNLKEVSGSLLSVMGEYPDVTKKKWLGTSISEWRYASNFSLTNLRKSEHKNFGVRIPDAGWHFSFVGGPEPEPSIQRIIRKIQSYAHQEFNNEKTIKKISKRLQKNRDIFGRRGSKFKRIDNLDFLPSYLTSNLSKFEHLIMR